MQCNFLMLSLEDKLALIVSLILQEVKTCQLTPGLKDQGVFELGSFAKIDQLSHTILMRNMLPLKDEVLIGLLGTFIS